MHSWIGRQAESRYNARMVESVSSPYIQAADAGNFESLVLENSKKGPVLVNFWSRKAGPCLRQYPVLDKVIHQYNGLLLLVNVDADAEVRISKEYGVASVPTLKLYRDGKVLETMHGFQSEEDIVKVAELYVARDSDRTLARAIQVYAGGATGTAYEMLAEAVTQDPVNPRLPLAICKLLKHEKRYDEAYQLIKSLPPEIKHYYEIRSLRGLLSLLRNADTEQSIESLQTQLQEAPDDLLLKQQLVIQYALAGRHEQAVALLTEPAAERDDGDGGFVHQALLSYIEILGDDHPLAGKCRRSLRHYAH